MKPAVKKVFVRLLLAAACLALLAFVAFAVWRVRLAHEIDCQLAAIQHWQRRRGQWRAGAAGKGQIHRQDALRPHLHCRTLKRMFQILPIILQDDKPQADPPAIQSGSATGFASSLAGKAATSPAPATNFADQSHERVGNPKGIVAPSPGLASQRAYPGSVSKQNYQPQRGCGRSRVLAPSGVGHNRVAVENNGGTMTQGSRCAATLGFGPQSLWDCQKGHFESNPA